MNIVIPAAGAGSRFANSGYQHPKPFIPIKGKSMLDWVIENVTTPEDRVYVILKTDHLPRIHETAIPFRKNVAIIPLAAPTEGAACTVLRCRPFIDNNDPLLIANSDQYVRYNKTHWKHFTEEVLAGMMTFTPEESDTRWSFAELNGMGEIVRVAEKNPISRVATVGVYYFERGSMFCDAADKMIAANNRTNGEFYVAPVFNYISLTKHAFEVDAMYGLGDPTSFEWNYEKVGT